MPDVGTLVTDAEVLAFTPSITEITTRVSLIIKSSEKAADAYCNRVFAQATYTDFPIHIRRGAVYANGILVSSRLEFRIPHRPITTWTSLSEVTARSPSTGLPTTTTPVGRDGYFVDTKAGIITLYTTPLTLLTPSLPMGVGVLLATFVAGYTAATCPAHVKEAILMRIARIFIMVDKQAMHLDNVSGEMGTTTYKRVAWTPEEKGLLTPERNWAMA